MPFPLLTIPASYNNFSLLYTRSAVVVLTPNYLNEMAVQRGSINVPEEIDSHYHISGKASSENPNGTLADEL
jgi:hypothetical protein